MEGPKAAGFQQEASLATWRHEFGHAMDYRLKPGGKPFTAVSSRKWFVNAYKKDREFFKQSPGVEHQSQLSRKAAEEIKNLPDAERQREVVDALRLAGLDETEVRTFLKQNSVMGYEGHGAVTVAEGDAIVWRFAKAWETGETQGLLEVLSAPASNEFYRLLGLASPNRSLPFRQHYMVRNPGYSVCFLMLWTPSLMGKNGHLSRHSASYYRKGGVSARLQETMADIVSILGSGPFGETLLRKVMPSLTDDLISYLKSTE